MSLGLFINLLNIIQTIIVDLYDIPITQKSLGPDYDEYCYLRCSKTKMLAQHFNVYCYPIFLYLSNQP